jgi:hypothetical protein
MTQPETTVYKSMVHSTAIPDDLMNICSMVVCIVVAGAAHEFQLVGHACLDVTILHAFIRVRNNNVCHITNHLSAILVSTQYNCHPITTWLQPRCSTASRAPA